MQRNWQRRKGDWALERQAWPWSMEMGAHSHTKSLNFWIKQFAHCSLHLSFKSSIAPLFASSSKNFTYNKFSDWTFFFKLCDAHNRFESVKYIQNLVIHGLRSFCIRCYVMALLSGSAKAKKSKSILSASIGIETHWMVSKSRTNTSDGPDWSMNGVCTQQTTLLLLS